MREKFLLLTKACDQKAMARLFEPTARTSKANAISTGSRSTQRKEATHDRLTRGAKQKKKQKK
jgi:hypothetical protein